VGAVIPGKAQISSACFHEDGRFLFAASSDDSRLQIIDCQAGKQISSPLRFEREGISLVEAT
jgi:WD40 repeat protein